jgi:adenylate cyclase
VEAGQLVTPTYFLVGLGLVLGLAGTWVSTRAVAEPLAALRAALAEVGAGRTDVKVSVDDGSEVGQLQAGFNQMVVGLHERQLLRDLFGRHVGEDVARRALDRGVELGGESVEAAVLFVDMVNSTGLAETRPPAEVVAVLNRFFGVVVDTVTRHGGWVNKFEGDGALCIFGAPQARDDAATCALAAARELQERLATLDGVRAAVSVTAGTVVGGNVGSESRYEYTVIGDPVNEAARLSELAKGRESRLLASYAAVERADPAEAVHWARGEDVVLRGRTTPTSLAQPSAAPAVPSAFA